MMLVLKKIYNLSKMIEKRKYGRKSVSLTTNIIEAKTNSILGDCILTDVSQDGFVIETETKLVINQQFNLNLMIQNKKISLSGKVVRITEGFFYPLYGIKLIEKDCKNLDFFKKYIEYSLN